MDSVSLLGASIHSTEDPMFIRHSVCVSSYQKLVHFLLISRLDITVICALHKANPNALSSSEHGASPRTVQKSRVESRVTSVVR